MASYSRKIVVFLLTALVLYLYISHNPGPSRHGPTEIFNQTLGFQEIFAVNLPERTDRRDAMTLMAAVTGIRITFLDGVRGADVPDKALPPGERNKNMQSAGKIGSWRAHMNVLQRVVERNITSALILEDDLDWDIRLKSQLQAFAAASQKFTQPLHGRPTYLADSYPPATNTGTDPAIQLSLSPRTAEPIISPYGDTWDILWLGHTGGELPQDYADLKFNTHLPPGSLLTILLPDDTVPIPRHVKRHPWARKTEHYTELYPPHTRVVHEPRSIGGVQAYAVSQRGARRLLHQFGLEKLTDMWDISLRDFCEGAYSVDGDGDRPVCVTTQPPILVQYWAKSDSDLGNIGGGYFRGTGSINVRRSVRLNLETLVRMGPDCAVDIRGLVDQWPDDGDGPW